MDEQKHSNNLRKLIKMTATGNDFLVIDCYSAQGWSPSDFPSDKSRPEIARLWCDRHFGLGADGIFFIEPTSQPHAQLRWDFFNCDGSQAEMCGNAARCMTLFCLEKKWVANEVIWETQAGLRRGWKSAQGIHVELPQLTTPPKLHEDYYIVNSGVPHAVVIRPQNTDKSALKEQAKKIRHSPVFGQAGTNVTFILAQSDNGIEILTYERGVEDFTLSCGTGAVAAAAVQQLLSGQKQINVAVPGGKLMVDLSRSYPILIGPAQFVAEIHPLIV